MTLWLRQPPRWRLWRHWSRCRGRFLVLLEVKMIWRVWRHWRSPWLHPVRRWSRSQEMSTRESLSMLEDQGRKKLRSFSFKFLFYWKVVSFISSLKFWVWYDLGDIWSWPGQSLDQSLTITSSIFRHEVLWKVLELLPYSRLGLLAKVSQFKQTRPKIYWCNSMGCNGCNGF